MATFNVMVAMCDKNRGFALNGNLPWPSIRADFDYYMRLTGTPADKGKVAVNIKGRRTWECSSHAEKSRSNVLNLVISQTMSLPQGEYVKGVFPSLQDALDYLSTSSELSDKTDSVWVMGGQEIYREALDHECCRRVYLTRVFGDYDADRFLPQFEHQFNLVDRYGVDSTIREENGVRFRFEIYERRATKP